jgi:DNA polymerase-1
MLNVNELYENRFYKSARFVANASSWREMALLPIITRMELHGFAVDVGRLKTLLPLQRAKAQARLQGLRDAFGEPELNANSPEQVLEVFKASGIELVKSTPDGPQQETTEEELLCTIDDPRAALMLEHRKADRLARELAALLEVVREDGRIYAQFNPLGAATGRFSSKNPNLQQVPKRGAKHVREIFVPGDLQRRLIVADYGLASDLRLQPRPSPPASPVPLIEGRRLVLACI